MATENEKKSTWTEIGRSVSSLVSKTERKEVKVDEYYVVVGFEVNYPKAFVKGVVVNGKYIPDFIMDGDVTALIHDLGVDYGHAFFYVVKNKIITKVFSFGPTGAGKVGWFGAGAGDTEPSNKYNRGAILKDGYKNSRPGTPDYNIKEEINAFKIPLTLKQGIALESATDEKRTKITSGKQKYTAYANDTCAEEARDVLSSAGIDTPSGSGWVKHSGVVSFPLVYAVNPYMWNHRLKAEGKFSNRSGAQLTTADQRDDPSKLIGTTDAIFE